MIPDTLNDLVQLHMDINRVSGVTVAGARGLDAAIAHFGKLVQALAEEPERQENGPRRIVEHRIIGGACVDCGSPLAPTCSRAFVAYARPRETNKSKEMDADEAEWRRRRIVYLEVEQCRLGVALRMSERRCNWARLCAGIAGIIMFVVGWTMRGAL